MNAQKNRGFTLIEIMLTFAVIGILATVSVPKVANMSERAHDAKIAIVADTIKTGMELYHQENGAYPSDADGDGTGPVTVTDWSSLNNALDLIEFNGMNAYNIGSEHEDVEVDDVFSYDVKEDGSYELKLASNTTGIIHVLTPDGYQ